MPCGNGYSHRGTKGPLFGEKQIRNQTDRTDQIARPDFLIYQCWFNYFKMRLGVESVRGHASQVVLTGLKSQHEWLKRFRRAKVFSVEIPVERDGIVERGGQFNPIALWCACQQNLRIIGRSVNAESLFA